MASGAGEPLGILAVLIDLVVDIAARVVPMHRLDVVMALDAALGLRRIWYSSLRRRGGIRFLKGRLRNWGRSRCRLRGISSKRATTPKCRGDQTHKNQDHTDLDAPCCC